MGNTAQSTPDRCIERIARRQHGVFTRAQAFGVGMSPAAISRRLKSGA